jgi:A/G-specific adenine glycosylase
MSGEIEPKEFRRRLLSWFGKNKRDLPWRRTREPYAIWVSEIMLQQTRVAAVIEHYTRFMERFPTLTSLADANEEEVLACWSGLGYYRRARLLHRAAQFVAQELGGKLPKKAIELRRLPGIGEYTCAAIASIAFGERAAVVDGNVERVLTRVAGWDENSATEKKIRSMAATLLDQRRPGDFNQAMMELGATVCLPRGPLCLHCPVQTLCATRGEHAIEVRKKMKSKEAAYAFLCRPGRQGIEVLLEQRSKSASLMAGMWELPQIDAAQADRERQLLAVRHSITVTNYYVTVYGYMIEEEKVLPESEAVRRWTKSRELAEIPLTGLARKVLKRLKVMPGYVVSRMAANAEEIVREIPV